MNMPASRVQREVIARVNAIADPFVECQRLWPDFKFILFIERWPKTKLNPVPKIRTTWLEARWTVNGNAHGLKDVAASGKASDDNVRAAKGRIARIALINHEYRKVRSG